MISKPRPTRTYPQRWQYLISLILSLGCWLLAGPIALAADSPIDNGATLFEAQCAACHAGGGNIIRRGKNLQLKTLERNHLDTLEAVQTLVSAGKGNMSAYADRLTATEITAVSEYVLAQAQQGWAN